MQKYQRDVQYWNVYYKNLDMERKPSYFANDVMEYINKNSSLLELGCGYGDDSIFFHNNDINVVAIDASEVAINKLKNMGTDIEFICGDFVTNIDIYNKVSKFDYCYSRFTIHAIDDDQESVLLKNVYKVLKKNGLFFIETRCIHDEIYGKGKKVAHNAYIYNDHFRRFIDKSELIGKLNHNGFKIEFADERRGYAPHKGEDPIILRIIARK